MSCCCLAIRQTFDWLYGFGVKVPGGIRTQGSVFVQCVFRGPPGMHSLQLTGLGDHATSTLSFSLGYALVATGFQQQTFNFNVAVSRSEHQGSEAFNVD